MKYLKNDLNIYFLIISFFLLLVFIYIYDIFLNENFFNYNFHYKSNVLDLYSIRDDLQLLKSFFDYNIFIDLSLGLLIANYIFIKIPKIVEDKKISYHLQIIWIAKIFFIFSVFSIYERNLILDQNVFFMGAINDFNTFEFLDFKNKYISQTLSSTFLLYLLKIFNLFLFDSWFALKAVLTLFYLVTIFFNYKIIGLFLKKNNIAYLYIFSCIPSLIYSSSLIVKDILVLSLISVFFFYYFKLLLKSKKNEKKKIFLIIMLLIIGISFFRFWMALSCLVCIFIYYLYMLVNKMNEIIKKYSPNYLHFVFFMFFLFFIFLTFIEEAIKLHSYLQYQIADSYRNFIANADYNSGLNLFDNIENYKDFISKLPFLYFYSSFNPFLENIFEFKYFIPILENLIFCLLIILSFFRFKFKKDFKPLIIVFATYIFIFLNIYMFVSGASIGTGFRYSVQLKIPLLTLLIILNKDKLNNYFFFLSKKLENIVFKINERAKPKHIKDR